MPPLPIPRSGPSPHTRAVLGTLLLALLWGASFAAMKVLLNGGLSVGAMLAFRFTLGGMALGAMAWLLKAPFTRQAVRDGICLGLVLTLVFWLQADGLRFTTTSKSGFITGLYVVFTPLVGFLAGSRPRLAHALGALVAMLGLLLLVHRPGEALGGWNRGDLETLLCAVGCGVHIVLTGRFSRRSSGWVLATLQVAVVALLSWMLTPLVSSVPSLSGSRLGGFQGAFALLGRAEVWLPLAYLSLLATALAFYLMATLQTHLGETEAAIIYSLEPVFTAFLAVTGWIPGIHEHLGPAQVVGGATILLAMLLAELGPRFLKPRKEALPG